MQQSYPAKLILEWCREIGFSESALIPAEAFGSDNNHHEAKNLQDWLKSGYQADMYWMEKHLDLRLNPATIMPGTQSIVVVALNYFNPEPSTAENGISGRKVKLSRYTWGKDYHKVLKKKLNTLLKRIQEKWPEAEGRALTDSAPVLEKALAVKAGLGWQGKNTLLLTKQHGSWVFIGELLLNLPVAKEELVATHTQAQPNPDFHPCGSCTRCLDACPTNAFVEPFVLDSSHCIAYWTIESDAATFPAPIQQHLEGWHFGCDICQTVCPWNIKFAKPTEEADLKAREPFLELETQTVLAWREQDFNVFMQNTPIRRTGLANLQRNISATL